MFPVAWWMMTDQDAHKSIGIAETRLVLARILWNFDIELCEETDKDWLEQAGYVTWQRKALIVRLRSRQSAV